MELSQRISEMQKALFFIILPMLFLMAGIAQSGVSYAEISPPRPLKIDGSPPLSSQRVTLAPFYLIQENSPPRPLKIDGSPPLSSQRVTLAPFYLIQEKSGKAWVERVIVSLEGEKALAEVDQPHLRGLLFEILISEPAKDVWPGKVQAVLDQVLGKAAVKSVHLSRCFLLF